MVTYRFMQGHHDRVYMITMLLYNHVVHALLAERGGAMANFSGLLENWDAQSDVRYDQNRRRLPVNASESDGQNGGLLHRTLWVFVQALKAYRRTSAMSFIITYVAQAPLFCFCDPCIAVAISHIFDGHDGGVAEAMSAMLLPM